MLITYKLIVILIFVVFMFFISDFRNKRTKPLIRQPWLGIMRVGYPIAPLSFSIFLITAEELFALDYVALSLIIIGTLVVIISKMALGKSHSWVGFSSLEIDDFCNTGIYSWIRHPLYVGIITAVLGTAFFVIPRGLEKPYLFIVYLIGTLFTFTFIANSSVKETEYLTEKFCEEYSNYQNQVSAFFPYKKLKLNLKRLEQLKLKPYTVSTGDNCIGVF